MNLVDVRATLPRGGPGSNPTEWDVRTDPPNLVCIHHSVTPSMTTVEAIASYHVSPPPSGKGRPTICYHYVIGHDGTVYRCVDDDRFVWHGNGGNTGIGVCLIGDFTTVEPLEAQLKAAADLVNYLRSKYGDLPVIGHREASGASTACPGNTWPQWKQRLQQLIGPTPEQIADAVVAVIEQTINYPRPANDTGAGVHLGANGYFPLGEDRGPIVAMFHDRPVYKTWLETCTNLRARGLTWVVVVTIEDSALDALATIFYAGLMPILRTYRKYSGRLNQKTLDTVRTYCEWGGKYVQIGNEPNLHCEWDRWPTASEWPAAFERWAREWYEDAKLIDAWGGLAGIDPLAPGGNYRFGQLVWGDGDDPNFLELMLRALKTVPGAVEQLKRSGWLSIHPALLNHPLDYPDDPINQAEHPGQTLYTRYYPNGMPTGASNCWRKWELYDHIVKTELGFQLPIIGTEGGAWSRNQSDPRYPALTAYSASDLNTAILRSMADKPRHFLAMCPWLWANRWWSNLAEAFEIDAWVRIPGWGNCPTDEPPKLPLVDDLLVNPIRERGAEPVNIEQIIGDALQKYIIPLNPKAAFEIAGKAKGLLPASPEVDVPIEGIVYRAQAYRKETERDWQYCVYCKFGDWGNLIWFKRAN